MDYNKIESLVRQAKDGDVKAKEELTTEFTPFIINLSKKSFVDSYEFEDIKNECYSTLFKCVKLYDCDKHRFVAYATNAIKNSVNNLIRVSVRREKTEGPGAFILDGNLENVLTSNLDEVDDYICDMLYSSKLKNVMKELSPSERELLDFVFFKKYTLIKYAKLKEIPYSTLVNRKNILLNKLRKMLNDTPCNYIN